MKTNRQATGRIGEDAACEYLSRNGQIILARNWHGGHGELDIVTLTPGVLHFVEVKTRRVEDCEQGLDLSQRFNALRPQDNVNGLKQMHLVQAACRFLHSGLCPASSYSEIVFDVVSVILDGDKKALEYIPRAFVPMYF